MILVFLSAVMILFRCLIIPVFDADKQLQSGVVNKRKCAVAELVTNYS